MEARKLKRLKILGLLVSVLGLSISAHAQAVPTATGNPERLQIGGGYTFALPDYAETNIGGITIYGTYDIWRGIGVEGTMHFITLHTPTDIGETTYLIGPRYVYPIKQRVRVYAKVLGGLGKFQFQVGDIYFPQSEANYGVLSMGGGVDIRVQRHINIRAFDFEAQKWLNFTPHTLSPLVYTFGVAYTR
jgi:hypothetical protein